MLLDNLGDLAEALEDEGRCLDVIEKIWPSEEPKHADDYEHFRARLQRFISKINKDSKAYKNLKDDVEKYDSRTLKYQPPHYYDSRASRPNEEPSIQPVSTPQREQLGELPVAGTSSTPNASSSRDYLTTKIQKTIKDYCQVQHPNQANGQQHYRPKHDPGHPQLQNQANLQQQLSPKQDPGYPQLQHQANLQQSPQPQTESPQHEPRTATGPPSTRFFTFFQAPQRSGGDSDQDGIENDDHAMHTFSDCHSSVRSHTSSPTLVSPRNPATQRSSRLTATQRSSPATKTHRSSLPAPASSRPAVAHSSSRAPNGELDDFIAALENLKLAADKAAKHDDWECDDWA